MQGEPTRPFEQRMIAQPLDRKAVMRRIGQRQDQAYRPEHIACLAIDQKTMNRVGVEFVAF